jgi:hypothetical protein
MPTENDIFVSYAHVDNKPFDNPQGWVDSFVRRLSLRLEQLTGREPSVWRDSRLQGNEYFVGSIGDGVSSTLLLLSVISPRYLSSAWCRGELKEFCRRAPQSASGAGNFSRVFKVVKTHVDELEMPEELRGLLGYHFYDFDERQRPREFRPDDPPNKDQRYWDRLEDLALDIVRALKTFGGAVTSGAAHAADEGGDNNGGELPLGKKVYLAETTADVSPERDRVRRELQQRGYYVLPDRELSRQAADFEEEVAGHLSRCALSVQLIGSTYGLIPEGEEERSIIRIQEELAARRASEDSSFSRLIWMPPGLEPQGNRHRAFVESLHTSSGAQLLLTSVEELKARVVEELTKREAAAARSAASNGDAEGPRAVYLICDNRDAGDVEPIEDYLYNQGFEVINSTFVSEGDEGAQAHRESLLNCDAALIYYGKANQMWLRSKLWDLQKARGWGRASPLAAKAVYVSAPQTNEKQRFRTHEVPLVIHNFEGFSPDALRPFVDAVRTGRGGAR